MGFALSLAKCITAAANGVSLLLQMVLRAIDLQAGLPMRIMNNMQKRMTRADLQ
jgi:hypothetical protein